MAMTEIYKSPNVKNIARGGLPLSNKTEVFHAILSEYFPDNNIPLDILEIGVYKASFIQRCHKMNLNIKSYTGVDPYSGGPDDPYSGGYWKRDNVEAVYASAKSCFKSFGATLLRMSSDDFFKSNTKLFDLIYVDGDHRYEPALKDMKNARLCLTQGGVMLIDDYANSDTPHVTRAVNDFIRTCAGEIVEVGYHQQDFQKGNKIIPINLIVVGIKFKS
ncbi:MAG: class I SAM-dependent methyltransferase [Dysgonamonadaceae bacterium]|jgi:hypothetical protein|nr:class I SAM-dependent methyltransferase [Dysgonamonadaceae bacterium]